MVKAANAPKKRRSGSGIAAGIGGDDVELDGRQGGLLALLGGFRPLPAGRMRLVVPVATLAAELAMAERFRRAGVSRIARGKSPVDGGMLLTASATASATAGKLLFFTTDGNRSAKFAIAAEVERPAAALTSWKAVVDAAKILQIAGACSGRIAFEFLPDAQEFYVLTETGAIYRLRQLAEEDRYPQEPMNSDSEVRYVEVTHSVLSRSLARVLPLMGAKDSCPIQIRLAGGLAMVAGTDTRRLIWAVDDDECLAANPVESAIVALVDEDDVRLVADAIGEDVDSVVTIGMVADRGLSFRSSSLGREFFFRLAADGFPAVEKFVRSVDCKNLEEARFNKAELLQAIGIVATADAMALVLSIDADSGECAMSARGDDTRGYVDSVSTVLGCEYSGMSGLKGAVALRHLLDAVESIGDEDVKIFFCCESAGDGYVANQYRVTDGNGAPSMAMDEPWVVSVLLPVSGVI
jgi:DNA polymerase III sliding clamp (beta) subunit (PCNA family)